LDFANPDGALYAGMYGQARLPITDARPTLTIPSSALIFDSSGVRVALVRDGKIHFQPVTVGRDLGTELEITGGLLPTDLVVANPGERLSEGGDVHLMAAPSVAGAAPVPGQRAAAN
jgi:multidrug efflux pump subunit AcrA (membrane-fusion protein)